MKQFLKDWALIIAIAAGIAGYFIYTCIPLFDSTHNAVNQGIAIIQPILIFAMLFLTFCKIEPSELRIKKWQLLMLAIQCGAFALIGIWLIEMPKSNMRIILEGTMICMICPTATAAAIITKKLGGDVNAITTYTILINLSSALLIPLMVPMVHPSAQITFAKSAMLILAKVFPLLLLPLASAIALKSLCPALHRKISQYHELSFYLWTVALALAIAMTTRSIMHCNLDVLTLAALVAVSIVCCIFQFWAGRKIGNIYGDKITGGQSLGQKNTVLAIWLGYTFFTPVTAMVGGFYSIWHNLINSWQLYAHKQSEKRFQKPHERG